MPSALPALAVSLLATACSGDSPQDLGDLSGDIAQSPADPVCVWNQAYIENYDADTVQAMLDGARGCYTLVDPFDSEAARDAIGTLKANGNTVGCYISVGTCERWRDDFDALSPYCSDEEWPEWPDEFFVNDPDGALPIMQARIQTLAGWGCDMVEFDNMDFAGESENFDLGVTEAQGAAYDQALCDTVHAEGMGCMAKNMRTAPDDDFDGGTFESQSYELDWWDHDDMQSFIDQGSLAVVFHYDDTRCDDVLTYYQLRYGSGVSFLCEDPDVGGYRH